MATFTITTTASQDARLVVAFGKKLGTVNGGGAPRNANAAEIKADIINYIRTVVADQERIALIAANPPATFDPT